MRRLRQVLLFMLGVSIVTTIMAQSHPFAAPETATNVSTGFFGQWWTQVSIWQSHFYRQLTGAVRAWQNNGAGAGWLLGLSFAYGMLHALGPGHGKAVIAAYMLATRQTARSGAVLALVSALVQAGVAILMVALWAGVFKVTARTMNVGTYWLETVSYALIVMVGAGLVWRRVIYPWFAAPVVQSTQTVRAQSGAWWHRHSADCGCVHVPSLTSMTGRLDRRRMVAVIAAVGLRPCSGALIVLVFALAQDFFVAGAVATLFMGLGTGLTVAALVVTAVWGGNVLTRLGRRLSVSASARLHYAVQALAALAVLMLGVLLLGGHIVSVLS